MSNGTLYPIDESTFQDVFVSTGNFIGHLTKKDALGRLNAMLGHSFINETGHMELLMYYHHRHQLHDIYTIYLLYYNSLGDAFVEYTLYEHNCDRQRRQPQFSDFKATLYARHEFFARYSIDSPQKFEWPYHHTEGNKAHIMRDLVKELRAKTDGDYVTCLL